MSKKTFLYADLTPAVWRTPATAFDSVVPDDSPSLRVADLDDLDNLEGTLPKITNQVPSTSIAVVELAPEGVGRDELRTTFSSLPSAHDEFDVYTVAHDTVQRLIAYEDGNDSDPSPDAVREISVVRPRDYLLYEFRGTGRIYVTTSAAVVRQICRRTIATHIGQSIGLTLRETDIKRLEGELSNDREIAGYKLANVQSTTNLHVVDVEGDNIRNNAEIQSARARASHMRAVKVRLQPLGHDTLIEVWVWSNGRVSFVNYPGDTMGLAVLHTLNPIIERCSDTRSITVR